ncbi:MAG: hypothetical protein Q7S61_00820 [bacterium]|nr:hypothetical protein [bacterium]
MVHDASSDNLIRSLDTADTKLPIKMFVVALVAVLVVGVGAGYAVSQARGGSTTGGASKGPVQKTAGTQNTKIFKDKAEGILKEGGVEGEGSFHLERPGGTSQNVYLTSSSLDLSGYIGRKVRVQGETFSAEKAGWLMDVGYVEVLQ